MDIVKSEEVLGPAAVSRERCGEYFGSALRD